MPYPIFGKGQALTFNSPDGNTGDKILLHEWIHAQYGQCGYHNDRKLHGFLIQGHRIGHIRAGRNVLAGRYQYTPQYHLQRV